MKIEKLYNHIEMAEAVAKFLHNEFVSRSRGRVIAELLEDQ